MTLTSHARECGCDSCIDIDAAERLALCSCTPDFCHEEDCSYCADADPEEGCLAFEAGEELEALHNGETGAD